MAVFALHCRVSSQQREAVPVLLYLLDGNIPALDGVALRAIRAHLPLVNIGVTIRAILPRVGEHRFDVALRALHLFVHATKGILGLIVVKLRNGANGPPTRGRVAVFARNRERSVRTPGALPLGRGIRCT